MPRVFIPPMLRRLTDGEQVVEVNGRSLREVIDGLEQRWPGVRDKLCADGQIKPGISVSIGDRIVSHGLASAVEPDGEIHFLPAIGGG